MFLQALQTTERPVTMLAFELCMCGHSIASVTGTGHPLICTRLVVAVLCLCVDSVASSGRGHLCPRLVAPVCYFHVPTVVGHFHECHFALSTGVILRMVG